MGNTPSKAAASGDRSSISCAGGAYIINSVAPRPLKVMVTV
jgi:hypothetical protein